ncbi:TolC family protein [Campylobacter insulaenigrae]|uniref:TolC family protein n=1 Tax=Campylobacter insulaenigrae TaxID=260714 RepID=UPI002152CADE|nr:TolC family protein [Campylobacter insulaenigrae]MCR6579190.1 TolC family protein [Campylobacter insulaenigrae]MCR6587334.1 TolC family protein [Campylobacter insulaenigrae]
MRKILIIASCFFIAACSLKPNLKISDVNYTKSLDENISINKQWWKMFNDDNLNYLVEQALKNNNDLQIAYINLQKAYEALGISRSDLLPKLDGSASGARSKTSINAPSNKSKDFAFGNDFKLGLNLSYEIDLWGKYRDNYGASKSKLQASEFDYESARLSLISNVTKTYFNIASLSEQVKILEESVQSYQKTYNLKLEHFKIGVISEYELSKFKAELDNSKILLTNAKIQKESNTKALKILTSNTIDDILYNSVNYTKIGRYDVNIPQGIGSEILLQRPDIQSALKILEEKNYLVGVARSAFLPNLSLTGLLGYESKDLDLLVKNGSGTWGVAGNFMMPIFHWGEIYNSVNIAKLSKDEAFLQYENTLKKAFGEIQLALFNRRSYYENEKNYENLFLAQSKIYEISNVRYENGVINLADYLQDQRNYLNAKLAYINSSYELANSIVDVIKAFGGGFNAKENSKDNIKDMEENLKSNFYNN